MKTTIHPYLGETDRQRVIDLRRTCTTPENVDEYPTVSDLWELLNPSVPGVKENVRLWENANGDLLGFAIVHLPYCNLYFQIAPQARDSMIENEIITWATERVRLFGRERGQPMTLDISCRDNDRDRIAMLEGYDFVQQEEQILYMVRSLSAPIPEPRFPQGFTPRTLAGEAEVEEYVTMHREAFASENMTVEHRLSMMRNPDYRPELDLVAVAPDGTFAAFCVCNIPRELNALTGRNEGEIGIIGTRPAFQNKGLGRATLLAGLQQLKVHGLDTAFLGTASSNTGAQRLYESVGFRTAYKILWFSKARFNGEDESLTV